MLLVSCYQPTNGIEIQVKLFEISPILSDGGILVDFFEGGIRVQSLFEDLVPDHEASQQLQVRLVVVGLRQSHRLGLPVQDPEGVAVLLDLVDKKVV